MTLTPILRGSDIARLHTHRQLFFSKVLPVTSLFAKMQLDNQVAKVSEEAGTSQEKQSSQPPPNPSDNAGPGQKKKSPAPTTGPPDKPRPSQKKTAAPKKMLRPHFAS